MFNSVSRSHASLDVRTTSLPDSRLLLIVGVLSAVFQSCGGEVRVGRESSPSDGGQHSGAQQSYVIGDGDGDGDSAVDGGTTGGGQLDLGWGGGGAGSFGHDDGRGFVDAPGYRLGKSAEAVPWDSVDDRGASCNIQPACQPDPPITCVGDCPRISSSYTFPSNWPVVELVAGPHIVLRTGMLEEEQEDRGLGTVRQYDSWGGEIATWESEASNPGNTAISPVGEVVTATTSASVHGLLMFSRLNDQTREEFSFPFATQDLVALPDGGFLLTGVMEAGFLPEENLARSGPKTLWWGDEADGRRMLRHRADMSGPLTAAGDRIFLGKESPFRSWAGDDWSAPFDVPFEPSDDPNLYHSVFITEGDTGDPLFIVCDVRRNTDERCRLSMLSLTQDNQFQAVRSVGEVPMQIFHVVRLGPQGKLVVYGKALFAHDRTSCFQDAIIQLDLSTGDMDWAILSAVDHVAADVGGRLVIARTIDFTDECEAHGSVWDGNYHRVQLFWIDLWE